MPQFLPQLLIAGSCHRFLPPFVGKLKFAMFKQREVSICRRGRRPKSAIVAPSHNFRPCSEVVRDKSAAPGGGQPLGTDVRLAERWNPLQLQRVIVRHAIRRCASPIRAFGTSQFPADTPRAAAPMMLFKCQHCEQLLYFENTHCEKCALSDSSGSDDVVGARAARRGLARAGGAEEKRIGSAPTPNAMSATG